MPERWEQESWEVLPPGGIIPEAGNSVRYETGSWRALRPVVDMEKCTHCMICWLFCPDSALLAEGGYFRGFALSHCKGCGICALECPPKCIRMVPEGSFAQEGA
ncbi:MAG: 4Fe-4S binding protein [Chloroflexi bacterium]|nr:4Fe-4S binding protein [Chloroflexota bacterium]